MSTLKDQVIKALRTVHDPEIPVDIYELGLVYDIDVAGDGAVSIRMTLTSPNCPVADKIPQEVQRKVAAVPGVSKADVELVFDPPWTREMMSEAAKLELEMMGIASPSHLRKNRLTDVTVHRTSKPDHHRP